MKNRSCQFWSNHKNTVCQFGKQTLLRPFPHITRCRSWTHFVFAAHCTLSTPIFVCEPLVCFVPPSCLPHFPLSTHAASCSCRAALPASTVSDPPPSCPVACWWGVALRSVHFPTACSPPSIFHALTLHLLPCSQVSRRPSDSSSCTHGSHRVI